MTWPTSAAPGAECRAIVPCWFEGATPRGSYRDWAARSALHGVLRAAGLA